MVIGSLQVKILLQVTRAGSNGNLTEFIAIQINPLQLGPGQDVKGGELIAVQEEFLDREYLQASQVAVYQTAFGEVEFGNGLGLGGIDGVIAVLIELTQNDLLHESFLNASGQVFDLFFVASFYFYLN